MVKPQGGESEGLSNRKNKTGKLMSVKGVENVYLQDRRCILYHCPLLRSGLTVQLRRTLLHTPRSKRPIVLVWVDTDIVVGHLLGVSVPLHEWRPWWPSLQIRAIFTVNRRRFRSRSWCWLGPWSNIHCWRWCSMT